MSALELLARLKSVGASVSVRADRLRCLAPAGTLTPALREALAQQRDELMSLLRQDLGAQAPLHALSRAEAPPASFAQQRLWFLDQLKPGDPAYNLCLCVSLEGALDIEALVASLNAMAARHEVLRTTFAQAGEQVVQVIHPPAPVDFVRLDTGTGRRPEETLALAQDAAREPFDLSAGPLLRARLIQGGQQRQLLVLTMHHIVSDGWSLGLMLRELAQIYAARVEGRMPSLPALGFQYADYAQWQRRELQGERLERLLVYWRARLAGGGQVLRLPSDRPRPALQAFRGAQVPVALDRAAWGKLRRFGHERGLTAFMLLLAVFDVLLSRYSGECDVSVGSPVANRERPETEPLVGLFANTLVLRTDLAGDPTFGELAERVRQTCLDAYAHQELPFEQLVQAVAAQRDWSRHPLFQVMLVVQAEEPPATALPGLKLQRVPLQTGSTKFDLTLRLGEFAGGLRGVLEYNTDVLDAASARRMAGHLVTLLEGATAPSTRCSRLPLLSAPERRRLVLASRPPARPRAEACLHTLFERQAERTPDRPAVVFRERVLTYADVSRQAGLHARRLRARGVGPGVPVALCLPRGVEMIVGVLAILGAGGAYLPLDIALPEARRHLMVRESQSPIILTVASLQAQVALPGVDVVCLDQVQAAAEPDTRALPAWDLPERPAYVIYTSGSAGAPKGVLIPHQAVVNLAHGLRTTVYRDARPAPLRVSLNGPLTFDTSVKQLVQPLSGHTLQVIPDELRHDDQALLACLVSGLLDVFDCTPAQLRPLVAAGLLDRRPPRPLKVLVGGEAIDDALWLALAGAEGFEFYNLYGPTECTVDATVAAVRVPPARPVVGHPLAGVVTRVLDAELEPVPQGVVGELFVAGAGVGHGYLRAPALTAERFLPDPYDVRGGRLYRTGDLARVRADGELELCGRLDEQVKIRGFRVELGEVESALRQHPLVHEAAVNVAQNDGGSAFLVAYVVPRSGALPTLREMRAFLLTMLPEYMLPSRIEIIDAIPLSAHRKLDRRALPAPSALRPELDEAYVAPRDPLEWELVEAWEELLDVRPVGVRDDFFELGGHSFLALRVLGRLRARFGQDLPLATLLQAPTIERLASSLRAHAPRRWSPLVTLKAGGSRPGFFCVHPVGGHVLCYSDLARAMAQEQPFHGLQSPACEHPEPSQLRLEALAARYVEAVRTVQPQGPFLLGGWSLGGVLAFEMARQLTASGERVPAVALFDTRPPSNGSGAPPADVDALVAGFWRDLVLRSGRQVDVLGIEGLDAQQRLLRMAEVAAQHHLLPLGTDAALVERHLRAFAAHRQAERLYAPQAWPGRVVLYQAEQAAGSSAAGTGWEPLATQGVELCPVPGDHYSMLRPPHVAFLARRLQSFLDSAAA